LKTSRFLFPLLVLLSGCSGAQSALNAEGHSAAALKDLIVFIVLVCTAVWLTVVIVMAWALMRRHKRQEGEAAERKMTMAVSAAIVMTVLIVGVLTFASFLTTRSIYSGTDADVTIRVRAQQWWWQFIYDNADPSIAFQTANEFHIPVGKDVRLQLEAVDVIHSFWVPSLAGKQDNIPGRENVLTLRADKPGIYRGQCAEFCGLQHSHMAFLVVAEEEADYQRWAAQQRQAAVQPMSDEAAAGQAVFMSKPCAACHTIRGTQASGTSGPDLTHVGSRSTIAAGLLETTRGSLAAWIADPQTLKPGNNMPIVPLTSDELRQISAYMEGLK
jgi:cytochrome c oxidase subunit 2